ncbi:unnamed protein product [Rhizophagus irregularis]|nr:unnamed protein product [Rhizophagus irregularis]
MNFSPEIFIEICSFLPPGDLFTLSQVCRKFRGYLCAPNSFATQQIWKESRLKFMPKEEMPPPEGMSEEKYAELLMTERGCQICKQIRECKIYWESEVRCCVICFYEKIVSRINLITKTKCSLEFVNIMPCAHTGYFYCKKYYWKEEKEKVGHFLLSLHAYCDIIEDDFIYSNPYYLRPPSPPSPPPSPPSPCISIKIFCTKCDKRS